MSQKFTTGQILAVISGRLLCPIDGIYEILNYMTQDDLFTHQLPRANDEAKPYVEDQIEWSEEVMSRMEWDLSNLWWQKNWQEFVKSVDDRYGKYHELEHMPLEDHAVIDAFTELNDMISPKQTIVVVDEEDWDSPSDVGNIDWKIDDDDDPHSDKQYYD